MDDVTLRVKVIQSVEDHLKNDLQHTRRNNVPYEPFPV